MSSNEFAREAGIRWQAKVGIICAVSILAYSVEVAFDLHERTEEILESNEAINLDAFFLISQLILLTLVVFKIVELRREVRYRRAAEDKALFMAYHDSLTGLSNRRKMEMLLNELPENDQRAVIMLDLNDFKPINDVFGHEAGDQLLVAAAQRITSAVGGQGEVFRFGGDEFAVLTGPVASEKEVAAMASGIAVAFEQPFAVGSVDARVGTAIGIALLDSGTSNRAELLRHADIALYDAKENLHRSFIFYEPEMGDQISKRMEMERKLRSAIDSGSVQPHFQPLVNLQTEELIGFEALARWTDPELGNVPPDKFIALAEETGLITRLSEHLLRLACKEAVKWPSHLKLSFNLSPKQLKDKLIGLRLLAILAESGLSPHRFEVEVTEGSLVDDKEAAREILSGLRASGIRIAVDDFGTGYSSLYHLLEFKFDNLKIDRSFINNSEKPGDHQVIVQAILALSHGLGLTATAEGIEQPEHVSKLVDLGCQQGQGYLFGKAMDGKMAETFASTFSSDTKQTVKLAAV